jgi:membrane fusion protein (multidrug efflux system)
MLRARVEEAKANEALAAVELDRADLHATFDGVVDRIPHKAGSAVEDDELLTTISDTGEVFAYFSISEREYLELVKSSPDAEGRQVLLELADGTMFPYFGHIDAVGSELDPQTGTLAYRARFPNDHGTLKHGSSGKIVIETKLLGALLVPQKATFEVQGDVYAFILDADNVVHARKIRVKERLDDTFVIDAGIGRGERYVLEGIQQVKDGTSIEPRDPDRRG